MGIDTFGQDVEFQISQDFFIVKSSWVKGFLSGGFYDFGELDENARVSEKVELD